MLFVEKDRFNKDVLFNSGVAGMEEDTELEVDETMDTESEKLSSSLAEVVSDSRPSGDME
eukprot:CAMPEP_0117433844 /NCGR_PEP_ID=MMETSP0758-20121206/13121_1 /TAXON_ID=63605 /ORGANISM="Percolomonas cosmopolitus, Strain AE-1 (ATCC 50343)" /LENGTH=59 /DNA_ID=CAMNT_0005224745 /DNA_START=122 /DNA_END=301 /DNA_ORIENTATION=-